MRYLAFLATNRRFLAFGFLLTLASSFGQTFFIALFGAEIRGETGLSHGDFGGLYSVATLASGLLLMWAGSALDRFDLRAVTAAVCAGLIASCAAMTFASAIPILLVALFGLRFSGQGLLSHISATSMARYFEGGPGGSRGRALSFASLGHPAGEALLPPLGVAAIAALGWRQTWGAIALGLALVLIPLSLWLLRGHGARRRSMLSRAARAEDGAEQRQWRRREVLKDFRLYLMLPAILAPAFINTGVFFHQEHLVETKGWSMSAFASAYTFYAVASVASALAAGSLVDRTGALKLVPAVLIPVSGGLMAMALSSHLAVAYVYMTLAGITQGANVSVISAMWAERYGVRHLGSIRAFAQSLMVLSTSLAPYSLGALIDAGVATETLFGLLAAYGALAFILVVPCARAAPRLSPPAA